MKKTGFTMIELIFVIVILGILAAVALPKFVSVGQQAHEGNLKSFTSTLQNTTGPTLWSEALKKGFNGDITKLSDEENATWLGQYIDIPKEIAPDSIDFTRCYAQDADRIVATSDDNVAGAHYVVSCRKGNSIKTPTFHVWLDPNNRLDTGDEVDDDCQLIQ